MIKKSRKNQIETKEIVSNSMRYLQEEERVHQVEKANKHHSQRKERHLDHPNIQFSSLSTKLLEDPPLIALHSLWTAPATLQKEITGPKRKRVEKDKNKP